MTGALFYANEYNGVPVIPAEPGQSYADALEAARRGPEVPEPVPGTVFVKHVSTFRVLRRVWGWDVPEPHVLNESTNHVAAWGPGAKHWQQEVRDGTITILETPED